jgi:hypothetical protein
MALKNKNEIMQTRNEEGKALKEVWVIKIGCALER